MFRCITYYYLFSIGMIEPFAISPEIVLICSTFFVDAGLHSCLLILIRIKTNMRNIKMLNKMINVMSTILWWLCNNCLFTLLLLLSNDCLLITNVLSTSWMISGRRHFPCHSFKPLGHFFTFRRLGYITLKAFPLFKTTN